jgi:hypothetical protein
MRLHPATFYLLSVRYATTIQHATSQQICDGSVAGDFRLSRLSGTCTYAKLLDAYVRQIYGVVGSTCGDGSLTAKEDFDAKLSASASGLPPELAVKGICEAMYDTQETT